MNRRTVCALCLFIAVTITACATRKEPTTSEANQTSQSEVKQSPAKAEA